MVSIASLLSNMPDVSDYMKALFFAGPNQPVKLDPAKFSLSSNLAEECQNLVLKLIEAVTTQGDTLVISTLLILSYYSSFTMVR